MLERRIYLDSVSHDAAEFIELVRTQNLDAQVPHCPGWDLRELARHVGMIHRWAYDSMMTGRSAAEQVAPTQREELVGWLDEGAARLIDHLVTTEHGTPTWTFGPQPRTIDFWVRRQPHEIAVHLYDARGALGLEQHLDPTLAADGVDEVVTMFFPRQVRIGRLEPFVTGVRLVATDVSSGPWALAGDGTDPQAATDATITGTAQDLLLALWHRKDWRTLSLDGDHEAAAQVIGAALTP